MSTQQVRVALCQLTSILGDERTDPRPDNLERGVATLRRAAELGAQLAVFGEVYLNGYRTYEYLYGYGVTVDPPDRYVQGFTQVARELGIHVIVGAATNGPAVPGDGYNSAIFLGPSGVIGVHHKARVAAFAHSTGLATKRCFYSPGRALEVFDSPVGRIGFEICYDISFPEVNRVLALKGATWSSTSRPRSTASRSTGSTSCSRARRRTRSGRWSVRSSASRSRTCSSVARRFVTRRGGRWPRRSTTRRTCWSSTSTTSRTSGSDGGRTRSACASLGSTARSAIQRWPAGAQDAG